MPENRALGAVLVSLVGLSAAAVLKLIVWPTHPPLPQEHLLKAVAKQLPLEPIATLPPQSRRDISQGKGRRYRWPGASPGGTAGLELELLPVRLRRFHDLGFTTIVELVGRPAGELIETLQLESDGLRFSHQPAQGNRPAQLELQTCLVPGSRAATDRDRLIDLLRRPPKDAVSRLRISLGLTPPRNWECVLITLSAPAAPGARQQLLKAWDQLRQHYLG